MFAKGGVTMPGDDEVLSQDEIDELVEKHAGDD